MERVESAQLLVEVEESDWRLKDWDIGRSIDHTWIFLQNAGPREEIDVAESASLYFDFAPP